MPDDGAPEKTRYRSILGGGATVACLLCLALTWSVLQSRRDAWAAAADTAANLATTLGQDIARTVESCDLALQSTAQAMGTPRLQALDPLSRHQATFGAAAARDIGALLVTDANGRVVQDSDALAPPEATFEDRAFFLVHKYGTAAGLFIGSPVQDRATAAWAIPLSRRITAPDGRFDGIVTTSIRSTYFAKLASSLHLPPGTAISLLGDDGAVLYNANAAPDAATPGLQAALRHLRGSAPSEGPALLGLGAVLSTASRLQELPLVLVVEMPLSAVYGRWATHAALTGGLGVLLLASLALLLLALRRQRQRLLRAERRTLELSERSRTEAERMHASKMEAVGRLTAGIAHDFNNYLQTIISSLEIISADYLIEPEAKDVALIAHKAANKGARLTHRLLTFSRQQVLQPRRIGVAFLLSDLRKLASDARVFETPVTWKVGVEPFTDDLHVDVTQLESCLVNLMLNARDAMPHGGTIHLEGRNAGPAEPLFGSLTPGRHVVLTVRDSGHGMDGSTRSQAFEPFFTTKAFGKGAGLGLAMAQGFCHQSGGDIRILDTPGELGTTIELWLPAAAADMPASDEIDVNVATMGRSTGRLLLIEDEPDVLVALSTILVSGGFEVVSVNSAMDGLMRLHDRVPYDAIVTDHAMPDMTGAALVSRVAAEMPNLPMLLLTGGDVDEATMLGLPRSVRLLRKPIRRMGLLNAVREAIGENSALLVS